MKKGVPLGADVAQVDGQVNFDLPLSLDLDLPLPLVGEVIDLEEPLVHCGCLGDHPELF